MCWSVFGGSHSGGAGTEEVMLRVDQKGDESSQTTEGMEENWREGNSLCQCLRNSRNLQDGWCLESKGGVKQGAAANWTVEALSVCPSLNFRNVCCFRVALRLKSTY